MPRKRRSYPAELKALEELWATIGACVPRFTPTDPGTISATAATRERRAHEIRASPLQMATPGPTP